MLTGGVMCKACGWALRLQMRMDGCWCPGCGRTVTGLQLARLGPWRRRLARWLGV